MPIINIEYSKLVDVTEAMCDRYCIYPKEPGTQEELNAICEKCPLATILDDDKESEK